MTILHGYVTVYQRVVPNSWMVCEEKSQWQNHHFAKKLGRFYCHDSGEGSQGGWKVPRLPGGDSVQCPGEHRSAAATLGQIPGGLQPGIKSDSEASPDCATTRPFFWAQIGLEILRNYSGSTAILVEKLVMRQIWDNTIFLDK